jgi:undecaprenyl diphosphate synthase
MSSVSFDIDALKPFPQHVAIIMDGNGRWSQARGLKRIMGHHEGVKTLKSIISVSVEWKLPYLTVFAFSSENWLRPIAEVNGLMTLLKESLEKGRADLQKYNIRLRMIGCLEKTPPEVQEIVESLVQQTKNNTGLQLTIALSYGGRGEIVSAIQRIAQKMEAGQLKVGDINESLVGEYLDTVGIPDPDLLIRTSGEKRLSNFLLWQCAYTEMLFVDTLWPDFSAEDFYKSLQYYSQRERRYGKVPS